MTIEDKEKRLRELKLQLSNTDGNPTGLKLAIKKLEIDLGITDNGSCDLDCINCGS